MFNLHERVALVTGAGSAGGIGYAVARRLVELGARVAITATTDRVMERARALGCMGHVADLTDGTQVAALFSALRSSLGPVEILVNNAGMVQSGKSVARGRLGDLSDADWAHHLGLNIGVTFQCTRAALPDMQAAGHGRIINMASVTGPLVTIDGSSGYATAKAGITGLTRSVALEYGAMGITCNAVLPGWIATESSSAAEIRAGQATPVGRPGTPGRGGSLRRLSGQRRGVLCQRRDVGGGRGQYPAGNEAVLTGHLRARSSPSDQARPIRRPCSSPS